MTPGRQKDTVINLYSDTIATVDSDVREGSNMFNMAFDQTMGFNASIGVEEAAKPENMLHNFAEVRLESGEALVYNKKIRGELKAEKVTSAMKLKIKGCKKHPKPPLPPRSVSLDLADQKLMRDISELEALKKGRIARINDLKKIKNGKAASSSSGNAFALVVTLLFCIVIFWQGAFSTRC